MCITLLANENYTSYLIKYFEITISGYLLVKFEQPTEIRA